MDPGARSDPEAAGDTRPEGRASRDTAPDGAEPAAANGLPETIADTSLIDVSESRLRVLKALDGDRSTASELARQLDANKSTVHGYLQDLVEDGFVERHEEEERLWVYYSLTSTGEAIVGRDRIRLFVDLGTLAAFLASAAVGAYELLLADPSPPTSGTLGGPNVGASGPEWAAIAYGALLVLVLAGLAARAYLRRRPVDAASG